jgi:hypothetical protein
MVPNIRRKNEKRMHTSNMVGRELSRACTSFLMLGMELMVLRGLKILMTLIADMLLEVATWLTQPIITTQKSNYQNNHYLCAYYIPGISHIGMRLDQEPKSNDLQDHLNSEDDLEDEVSINLVVKRRQVGVIQCKKHAVCQYRQ